MRLALALILSLSQPQTDPSPAPLYEAVLRSLREQHPGKQLVLRSGIANATCVEQCAGPPIVGTHEAQWIAELKASRLIANECRERPGLPCARRSSKDGPDPEDEIEVVLSDVRRTGDGTGELVATHSVWGSKCRLCAYTVRYGLREAPGSKWEIAKADTLDVNWLL